MSSLFWAARAYIDRLGFALVVADAEKVPLGEHFPHGASSASKDLRTIARALHSTQEATLATRIGFGYLVLDVDVRHGGIPALERLTQHFGQLPTTWRAETPTGGLHIWFRTEPLRETKGKLCNGVEVLRGNRLVTLSPSERAGGRYRWVTHPLRHPIADCPEWIISAITPTPAPRITPRTDVSLERRVERAKCYLERLEPAVSGNYGHSRTFLAAQIVTRGFSIDDESTALSVLNEWNQRCDPPWSERELRRKVREAMRRGRMQPGCMLEDQRA